MNAMFSYPPFPNLVVVGDYDHARSWLAAEGLNPKLHVAISTSSPNGSHRLYGLVLHPLLTVILPSAKGGLFWEDVSRLLQICLIPFSREYMQQGLPSGWWLVTR